MNTNYKLTISLITILFISLITGLIVSLETSQFLNQKIAEAEEAKRPAELEIIILKESNCKNCSDIASLVEMIKKENTNVNEEKTLEITSPEGMELINKFSITKAPTVIITGEIEKNETLKNLWSQLGEIMDNTFVLREVPPPYILTASGDVRGEVELTLITDSYCEQCYNVTIHQSILQKFGLFIKTPATVEANSPEGRELINKYQIKLLPTIILTGDIELYPSLESIWSQIGTIEKDGTYVFRDGVKEMGTYKDLHTNQIITPTAEVK